MTALRIEDVDRILEFTFDDLVKYHGTRSVCGLTVAFKVMERGFDALGARETPLRREAITVFTAFPGPGARDAFECVTRAVSRERYTLVKDVEPGEAISEAAFGAYYFRIGNGERSVSLGVRPGVVRDEFLALRRKEKAGTASADELDRFRVLQWELSDRIREADPASVVNIL